MPLNALRDCTSKYNRDGITNLFSNFGDVNPSRLFKFVVVGKALENRGLTQRDGAILCWMSKATSPKSNAMGCHGRGRSIPSHSTVDRRHIRAPGLPSVTFRHQILRPMFDAPAIPRRCNYSFLV